MSTRAAQNPAAFSLAPFAGRLRGVVVALVLLARSVVAVAEPASVPAQATSPAVDGVRATLVWDAASQRGALATGTEVIVAGPHLPVGAEAATWQVFGRVRAEGALHLAAGPEDGMVYASATTEGVLKFIQLAEARQVHQVPAAGASPGPLVYHPVLRRLASFNAEGAVTLFDVASRAYEGLLPLGETPADARLAPDGRVLALLPQQGMLALLALRPFRMFGRFPLSETCQQASALAVDPAAMRVFVQCGAGALAVFDLRLGEWQPSWHWPPSARLPGGLLWTGSDARLLALDADGRLLQAAAPGQDARVLQTLTPGTAMAWDGRRHALVLARPLAAAAPVPFEFSFLQDP